MGRQKVRLELITKEPVRRTTFRKRKAGLLKKANELTTLCGVEGCAIIYGPNEPDINPRFWPSKEDAERVLARFKSLPPAKQNKHMLNHMDRRLNRGSSLTTLEAGEAKQEQIRRDRELELEALLEVVMEEDGDDERLIETMSLEDMKDLYGFVDKRVEAISNEYRVESIDGSDDVELGAGKESRSTDE